jgi:hypothetical protein
MVAQRRKLTTREKIKQQRLKVWDLYCKSRVAEALENTKDSTFKDIYNIYRYSFNLWGGVELVFWLEALVKKFKTYDSNIEPIAIFPLSKRTDADAAKIQKLKVIAHQMGLDVTITSNVALKPARVATPRVRLPKNADTD